MLNINSTVYWSCYLGVIESIGKLQSLLNARNLASGRDSTNQRVNFLSLLWQSWAWFAPSLTFLLATLSYKGFSLGVSEVTYLDTKHELLHGRYCYDDEQRSCQSSIRGKVERHCSSYHLNNKKYLEQIIPLKSVLYFQLLKIQSDYCISIFIPAHLLDSLCIYFLRTFSCPSFGPSSQAHGDFGKNVYLWILTLVCVSAALSDA